MQVRQRECQSIGYARRRTGDWFLDTGSIPVRSTHKLYKNKSARGSVYFLCNRKRCPIKNVIARCYEAHSGTKIGD